MIYESNYCEILKDENVSQLLESEKGYLLDLFEIDSRLKVVNQNKINVIRAIKELEVNIKITESHSVMEKGFQDLKNETARNGYRRLASESDRKKLAKAEADLQDYIQGIQTLERDRETLLSCIQGARTRMNLVASIFNYLSGK